MLRAETEKYTLRFARPARTSREVLDEKPTYFLRIRRDECPDVYGVGEVPIFPSLQCSFRSWADTERQLKQAVRIIENEIALQLPLSIEDSSAKLPYNSGIRFGVESALADLLYGGKGRLVPQKSLANIHSGIRINGLIWMADIPGMLNQIESKIKEGFRCLKLKIGANAFDDELEVLRTIRSYYPSTLLEIRLDANGAFSPQNVFERLEELSRFDIHSIEQPLPRDSEMTPLVCRHSPIPIALDEDMIERRLSTEEKFDFLNRIHPHHIIIKPSLIGGFEEADRWIDVAKALGIGWWATSALESNVGLSAIAQWLSRHPEALDRPHGLGTGEIYINNVKAPVRREGERIFVTLPDTNQY